MSTFELVTVGFAVVFMTMAAIILILMLIPIFFGERKKEHKYTVKENNAKSDTDNDDNEIIAVLTAAVMAYMGENKRLRITSFRRIGDNSPAWNKAARATNNKRR